MLPLLLLLLLGSGARADEASALGQDVAAVAMRYRDTQPKLRINACNGLVEDILRDAGLELRGGVKSLYAQMKERGWVHRRKHPLPGDIVFFDKTYDSNGNGRQDDLLSHVAVVINVDSDGTVHMVHRGSKGIRPLTLNLNEPSVRRRESDGKVLNSWLGKPGYAQEGHKLAGELWTAYASPSWGKQGRPAVLASANVAAEAKVDAVVRTPTVRSPRRDRVELPLALDDTSFERAWDGKKLRAKHLDGMSCLQLWYLRNTVFARHGYDFRTPSARRVFDALPGYEADPRVTGERATRKLSNRDEANLAEILRREARCR